MRAWIVVLCVAVFAVAAGALVATGTGGDRNADSGLSSEPPTEAWTLAAASGIPPSTSEPDSVKFATPGPPPGDPRALTREECIEARPRMEAQDRLRRPSIATLMPDQLERFDAAVAESRAWFDAGCPPHETLGYYPFPDGTGHESVLIDF